MCVSMNNVALSVSFLLRSEHLFLFSDLSFFSLFGE